MVKKARVNSERDFGTEGLRCLELYPTAIKGFAIPSLHRPVMPILFLYLGEAEKQVSFPAHSEAKPYCASV